MVKKELMGFIVDEASDIPKTTKISFKTDSPGYIALTKWMETTRPSHLAKLLSALFMNKDVTDALDVVVDAMDV